jgi:hypothetical protein
VAGVSYGLPDWIYHSDTTKQLLRVVPFMRGDLVPEDTYPVLHMYLAALVLRVGALIDPHGPAGSPSWPQVVVTVRVLNAVLGTAAVGLLAVAARWLFGWRVGLLAAGLLATSAPSIVNAHYEMGDVPQAFFVVAAFTAAASALVGGRAAPILATGALAGLAASAKFFGVVVIVTALVALFGGRRRSPERRLALLVATGLLTVAAFALSTPLALFEPSRWLHQIQRSPELFLGVRVGVVERLWLGSRVVLGLALGWFGLPLCLGALAGAVVLARRGRFGALVLATPLVVLGIYVWFRPHGLDDRYLVILAPFVAVAAAVAVAALARWSGWAAGVAGLALVVLGSVDALHVAYLFWTDDTRELALQWQRRYLPPDAHPIALPEYARDAPRARGATTLVTDTQSDDRLVVWYSAQRMPSMIQAFERLERDGKLLRRFELLPRGFIAPTISYYDLESMAVPYVFPPPDDAASDEAVVFVDPDAVPDRTAVVVTPGYPRTWTLVSRTPLPRIALALSGESRVRVDSGLWSRGWAVDPRHARVVEIAPWRGFPWFKHVYRIGLETAEGRIVVRLLRTPCEVAERLLDNGDWAGAIRQLDACRGRRWLEPARLLDLAWARVHAGQPAEAHAALDDLRRAAPGLLEGLVELAGQPDGDAWRARHATLVGRGRFTWYGHTFRGEAEATSARIGVVVEDGTAHGGQFVRATAGETPAGLLKVWLSEHFLRGRFLATFRVRGARAGAAPLAKLEIVRHLPGRGYDAVASQDWTPRAGPEAWEEVVLPVTTDLEPVDLELRVHYHGRGRLDVDGVTVVADVRGALIERLTDLGQIRLPAVPAAPR